MSKTHGGENKEVHFIWGISYDNKYIVIVNLKGKGRCYLIDDVCSVLDSLRDEFSQNWFPLGNNVEKLRNGTERKGLGFYLYEEDTERKNRGTYAQGASYLGVVLEEVGILELKNESVEVIQWRIPSDCDIKESVIRSKIKEFVKNRPELKLE